MNLVKLCVGAPSVEALMEWRAQRRAAGYGRADGCNMHRTRMMPKLRDEIIGQGSLYWVMSGVIRCRQKIVALEPSADAEGRSYCDIIMDPEIVLCVPQPKRPFQGWRYLKPADAPRDIAAGDELPDGDMGDELARMGLL